MIKESLIERIHGRGSSVHRVGESALTGLERCGRHAAALPASVAHSLSVRHNVGGWSSIDDSPSCIISLWPFN